MTDLKQSGRPLKVLQITDTHLFADTSGKLLGLETERSLCEVIDDASRRHLPADLILATGDLAHDGTAAAYGRCLEHLGRMGPPVYCLPGNHDEAATLKKLANDGNCLFTDHACHGDWHFIFLDSSIPDSDGAHLPDAALQRLESLLATHPDHHTLVCLHHQPVPMGSAWLDTMALDNPDQFFAVIDRHPQVRGIVWGHVHQEYHTRRGNIDLYAAPSTCIQFLPHSREFALDMTAPGYRWLLLHTDGTIDSAVERLERIPGIIDTTAIGY